MKVSVCKEEFEQTGLVEIAFTCGHVILASASGSPQISHKIEICYFFMPSLCYRGLGMREVYMNKPYLILLQNFLFH